MSALNTPERRRAAEEAVRAAVERCLRLRPMNADTGQPATPAIVLPAQLYGFAPAHLQPEGFTMREAVRAAKRLERRGELVGVDGRGGIEGTPRGWRLP